MVNWQFKLPNLLRSLLLTAALLIAAAISSRAQDNLPGPQFPGDVPLPPRVHKPPKPPKLFDQYPRQPSQPPEFIIRLAPLGFSAPGTVYLLRRQSLVSLDFLDEDRLLFSFQVPSGLVRRDTADHAEENDRHVRAVVLSLPNGHVESEAQWIVPDPARYLWILHDGRFLLRSSTGLELGDATLKTSTVLQLPGHLLWLAMDPAQKIMVTNSLEPADAPQTAPGSISPAPGPLPAAATQQPNTNQTLVARTFERESGQLIKTTRVPFVSQTRDWPISSDGYLEASGDSNGHWLLTLNNFAVGNQIIAHVRSTCKPTSDYVSERELLVSTCEPRSGGDLLAMSVGGVAFWQSRTASNEMWPLLVNAPNGTRVARETILLKRFTNQYKRLVGAKDLQGQMVRVFDAADGSIELEAPLTPALDGGGNVAISPSGRRVAILNAGAIQVFELPPPARTLLPKPAPEPTPH